jgi:hypothetical protein
MRFVVIEDGSAEIAAPMPDRFSPFLQESESSTVYENEIIHVAALAIMEE